MKHKDKVKLGRKLLTREEERQGVSKFLSAKWLERKEAIELRQARRQKRAKV